MLTAREAARLQGFPDTYDFRSDPNAELATYGDTFARKIEFNTPLDTVRALAKRPHTPAMVTVAVRSDGSVESVSFVLSSGVAEIDDAIRRIRLFSSIHRRLHDPDGAAASLDTHFRGLFDELVEATDTRRVECDIKVGEVDLPVETVMTLSLIAAELMTNAIKHAFVGRPSGKISLGLRKSDGGYEFVISDDGVGKAADCEGTKGLGCMIVEALCEQISAKREVWVDAGTHVRLRFPGTDFTKHI